MPKEPVEKKSKTKTNQPLEIPPVPDKPQQCHFFVARKRRYCHLPAKKTQKYCGEHMTHDGNNETSSSKRIPCPYDKSHTIFEKDLQMHLEKRCNSRPRGLAICHSLNINCTLPLSLEELEFQKNIYSHQKMHVQPWLARVQLKSLTQEQLKSMYEKINAVKIDDIPIKVSKHVAVEQKRPEVQWTKHLDQQSSLIGHMESNGMLQDKSSIFVEFGAGKGDLSGWVKKAVNEENGEASYVLIDRKNVRSKVDPSLVGHSQNKSVVQRLLMDIKDIQLAKVESIADNEKKVVAFSKHLCGCATDITLKCLMNYVEHERSLGRSDPITGIVIAVCCHQLCRYEMYPNVEFLESIKMDKAEFEIMCKMSSWGISGEREEQSENSEENEHVESLEEEEDNDQTSNHFTGLDRDQREKIGYHCKRILDTGRVKYLEKYGFGAKLVYYVDPSTSLENCALIATPKKD
ncbi:methyltransferase TRM13-domain-containing protein [Sporodiniella umbellata]|nr:methyltransferase TRM13-domain-containing protein [Sporodiniella umbellata]